MYSITYIITRDCNTVCNNCPIKKESKSMTAETFFNVSAVLLSDKLNDFNTVKFFGGEPLLNFKLIRQGYNFLKKHKNNLKFEIGTNGILLDYEKYSWLYDKEDIQLNFNAAFAPGEYCFKLKNAMWNLCIQPDNPEAAIQTVYSLAGKALAAGHRINLLPAVYCVWNSDQLYRLGCVLCKIVSFLDEKGVIIENRTRKGDIPLFNDGLTVDTDGTVYTSNICLSDIPKSLQEKVKYKIGESVYQITKSDLISVYGMDKIASSYAVGYYLEKYACS